jgi:hypothetical protein
MGSQGRGSGGLVARRTVRAAASASLGVASLLGLVAVLAGGCKRVDYVLGISEGSAGATGTAPGGESGAGGAAHASAAGLGAFGPPQLVVELSEPDAEDDDPSLTPDLREIWFSSSRPGGLGGSDIWHAVRADPSDPWEAPTPVDELSSSSAETSVAVSRDGLEIWITTDRPGGLGGFDVWVSTRQSREALWPEPVPVPELNSPDDDLARGTDGSGLLLLMASKRSNNNSSYDLLVASRADAWSAWSTPISITELNTAGNDADPFLAADERTLFFTSDRAGTAGDDLYAALRADPGAQFSSPEPLAELNGPRRDSDPWVSDDLRYIIYASERDDQALDLYEAWR